MIFFQKIDKHFAIGLAISIAFFLGYIFPLLGLDTLYVLAFDNLDANIVWYKILANSGMIFQSNNAIVPNMMLGLPRSVYPGEFNVLLWLYYFFDTPMAYVVNEIVIHMVAGLSMYLFLKRYILAEQNMYNSYALFFASIYFSFLPFWSNAGLSVVILPLITYSLLNVKNNRDNRWDWALIILLPLYTSFVMVYIFYIAFIGLYMLWELIVHKVMNKRLLIAVMVLTGMFVLSEYRLFMTMFFEQGFKSHREEFNIYFNLSFHEAHKLALSFFLDGWSQHLRSLMMPVMIPIIFLALLLSHKRVYSSYESMAIWLLLMLSFYFELWQVLLTTQYTLPLLLIVLFILLARQEKKHLVYLLLFQVILAIYFGLTYYEGVEYLKSLIPMLKSFNISRAAYIQPFIWGILLALSVQIILKKLKWSILILSGLLLFQYVGSLEVRNFSNHKVNNMFTFEEYYATHLFKSLKNDIKEPLDELLFISYGLEPAVAQYNGLYTADGYMVNYPLEYKKQFRVIQEKCFELMSGTAKNYDVWGSKVYLMCIDAKPENYHLFKDTNITEMGLAADTKEMCHLGVDYLISAHTIKDMQLHDLELVNTYHDAEAMWDISLYKLTCENGET